MAGWRRLAQLLFFVAVACLAAAWYMGNGNLKFVGIITLALHGAAEYAARARGERAKREEAREKEPVVPR
jgi:hypothetical protein